MEKLKSLERLEEALARLPSVGKRSAERMAYAMLNFSDEDLLEISDAIRDLKTNIRRCTPLVIPLSMQSGIFKLRTSFQLRSSNRLTTC